MDTLIDSQKLKHWCKFAQLSDDFSVRVKLVWIHSVNEAFVVTLDDEVFAFGENKHGCLGLGDQKPASTPRKVPILCGKNVVDFAIGGYHVLALTRDGAIYAWGQNDYGQIGDGTTRNFVLNPTLVQGSLRGKIVTSIACGFFHSLAVTKEGQVFAWGRNDFGQIGDGTTFDISIPKNVYGSPSKYPQSYAVKAACGGSTSWIVLNSGQLFSWGKNESGQLGLGFTTRQQPSPCHVSSMDAHGIEKIAVGPHHTLALTRGGQLYSWGWNQDGQLGTGDTRANSAKPTRVAEKLGRITDITAFRYLHMSAAISQTEKTCYIWGKFQGRRLDEPLKVNFSNFPEALMFYESFYPFAVKVSSGAGFSKPQKKPPQEQPRKTFNVMGTPDVKFLVDGKELLAYKELLKSRCGYFRTMFDQGFHKAGSPIEIKQYTYTVYKAFLEYLHHDKLASLSTVDAIMLMELSKAYSMPDLKMQCEELLKTRVSVANVANLYAVALKYDGKKLGDFCSTFFSTHMAEAVQTEAFQKLDGEVCKSLIAKSTGGQRGGGAFSGRGAPIGAPRSAHRGGYVMGGKRGGARY